MTEKRKIRWSAFALALCVVLSLLLPAARAASEEEIILSGVEELLKLSHNCALDSWSRGKTVLLTADLDLTGIDFVPIPTFGGTFRGQGHTISGLRITAAGSDMGLFRYLQPQAVVEDLTVQGSVSPTGSRCTVGGVVGNNAGTVRNCAFHGVVLGDDAVGGIVGRNETEGQIIGCSSYGAVSGKNATGGIAGRNSGLLLKCENHAGVNLTQTERELDLMAEGAAEALTELATASDEAYHLLNGCSDTGGIVGWTGGVVQGCVNSGNVGYPHVGYNTGGVAGRQSGYMAGCVNNGAVHGRKDVGGVVGQAEPYVVVEPGRDTLDRLQKELDTLDRLVEKALDDGQGTGDAVSAHLTAMGDHTDGARDSAKRLLDRVTDFTDETVETVNLLTADITNALDRLAPALDDFSAVGDRLEELSDSLGRAMDHMEKAVDTGNGMAGDLDAAAEALKDSGADLGDAADELELALDALTRGLLADDDASVSAALTQLHTGLRELRDAFSAAEEALEELRDLLRGNGSFPVVLPDTLGALGRAMGDISSSLDRLERALPALRADWKDARSSLKEAFGALEDGGRDLDEALDSLRDALGRSDELAGELGDALEELGKVSDSAASIGELLSGAFHTAEEVVEELTAEGPRKFTPLGEEAREAGDSLFSSLSGLSEEMGELNSVLQEGGDLLTADLRAISRQCNVIFDVLLDALSDARDDVEGGVDSVIQDTSDEDIAATREGKMTDCRNTGTVEGDRNVGGLVGSVAVEADLDPEDDLAERMSFGASFATKAVLQNGVNRGKVTAKKDCAGGLVGRMDLGTVLDCQSYGRVDSESGNYVGGAVGLANATVRSCFTKSVLSGKKYVGGIVGWASRVRDCCAITTLLEGTECLGAIAGGVETNGVLTGNRFLDTGLAGVDGVSYAGRAEPVGIEELSALPGVPAELTAFTLTLTAEGETVTELPFLYGEDLSQLALPPVPEREGFYGRWPEFDVSGVSSDVTAEAVYTPWITVAASPETNGKLSLALVEGRFTREAVLHVTEGVQPPPPEAGEEAVVWEVSLTGISPDSHEKLPLRLLSPGEGKTELWRYENGQWEKTETVRNGQYLLVDMEGTEGTFCLQERTELPWLLPAVGAGLLLLLLLITAGKRRKKRKAARAAKKPEKTAAGAGT